MSRYFPFQYYNFGFSITKPIALQTSQWRSWGSRFSRQNRRPKTFQGVANTLVHNNSSRSINRQEWNNAFSQLHRILRAQDLTASNFASIPRVVLALSKAHHSVTSVVDELLDILAGYIIEHQRLRPSEVI